MRRFATIALIVWVWAASAHAQSALTPADSLDRAIASVLYPSITTELDGKPLSYKTHFAKGLRDGAADTTLIAYAKAILIGAQMQDWVDNALYGEKLGADRTNIINHLCSYIEGATPSMTPEAAQDYIRGVMMNSFEDESQAEKADPEAESAFLAAAAATEGAIVTPDSVVIITETAGTGATPAPGSTAVVIYTASLSDGSVFDETGGNAVRLAYDSLVPGMQQGLSAMRAGGKARIYIPAAVGYGAEGYPGVIPGGAVLLFDLELKDVQ